MNKPETVINAENRQEAEEIYEIVHDMNQAEKEKFLFFIQGYKQGLMSAGKEAKKPVNQSA